MGEKYIILSEKKWHKDLFENLKKSFNEDSWLLIDSKKDFNLDNLSRFKPSKIFIPHWSYIIPSQIYNYCECIAFHMTDLPFGRGGSPLQNLISRGYKTTKISAIRVEKGIDTGDIYLKKTLKLDGTAEEIFFSANFIIEEIIREIINNKIQPEPQVGEITVFKRRIAAESNIAELHDLEKVFDYIRMLDCQGYPNSFIETTYLKFEFTNASYDTNEELITANVRISKK